MTTMARWVVDDEAHPRRSLFLRTQAPFVVLVLVVVAVGAALGIRIDSPAVFVVGLAVIVSTSALSLLAPWERLAPGATAAFPVLDLCGIIALAVSVHGSMSVLPVLAIFPAVWLAMDHDLPGAVAGVLGALGAAVAPLFLSPEPVRAEQWIEALVVLAIVSTAAVASALMAARVEQTREQVAATARERDAAAAETARLGAALRSFSRQADVGIVLFGVDGEIVVSNDAAAAFGDLADYDVDFGGGRQVFREDQVTPLPPAEQPLTLVATGAAVHDLILWVGARGEQRALLANGAPVVSATGAPAGSFLILQEVTAVILASRERESALATLAHELRTPLTAIIGYLDLVELTAQPAEAAKVAVAIRNAEHMLALTTAFLSDLRRPPELAKRVVSLSAIVDDAVAGAAALPNGSRCSFVTSGDLNVTARVDPDGIRRIVDNLLSNAVKFSDGGIIGIDASAVDGALSLTVRNDGSRLDDDDLERIFDRYHRGANAKAQAVAGTGLGLAISREIARRHGGTLTAARHDSGMAMTLRIPLDDAGDEPAPQAAATRQE